MALAVIENTYNSSPKQAYFIEDPNRAGFRFQTGLICASGIDGEFISSAVSRIASKLDVAINPTDSLANVKYRLLGELSRISMHLNAGHLESLSRQLDSVLSEDEWDESEPFPQASSWRTLLRVLNNLAPKSPPRLTFHNGSVIMNWYSDNIDFSVECLDYNRLAWVASIEYEGGMDISAGETKVPRIRDVADAYNAKSWLF